MKFFAPKPEKPDKLWREAVNGICPHKNLRQVIERFGPYNANTDTVHYCVDCGAEVHRSANRIGRY